jgi:hypothetical protein
MNRKGIFFLFLAMFLVGTAPAIAKESKFVGVKSCKKCHKKKKEGDQFGKWAKSKHAKAYKLLASKKALKKAKEMGLKTHPQKSIECLICHTAGAGLPKNRFAKKFKKEDGVQCENCHGAGSNYKKKKLMKKLRKERKKGGHKLADKVGLTYGNEKTCTNQCHQKERTVNGVTYINPSYKEFKYKERIKEIAHPIP